MEGGSFIAWLRVLVVLVVVILRIDVARAEALPPELLGTYEGALGDAPLVVELMDREMARVTIGGASLTQGLPIPSPYKGRTGQGEHLVQLMLPRMNLVYAVSPTKMEMRAPADPGILVTGKDGSPVSVLYREGAHPDLSVSREEEDAAEDSPSPAPDSDSLYQGYLPWNAYDPSIDDSHQISRDASDLPACPPGTSQVMENAAGGLIKFIACSGGTYREGPLLGVIQTRVKVHQGTLVEGKKQGRFVQRATGGWKASDGFYLADEKHGLWLIWDDDGQFQRQELWDHGALVATGREGDGILDAGSLPPVQFGCPAGTDQAEEAEEGLTVRYCLDGSGRKQGLAVGIYENGHLALRNHFEDDLPHGVLTSWYPSGQIRLRLPSTRGLPHGVGLTWHENGVPASRQEFSAGLPVGVHQEYNRNGGVVAEGAYKEGKKDGTWKMVMGRGLLTQRWENGNLKSGRLKGLMGDIPMMSEHPKMVEEGITHLGPVLGRMEDFVSTHALVEHSAQARQALDQQGHHRDRTIICEDFYDLERTLTATASSRNRPYVDEAIDDTIAAFCEMRYSPNRDPWFPENPVLLDCSISNSSGSLGQEGTCLEMTPAMCVEILSKMCEGCKNEVDLERGWSAYTCPAR